MREPGYDLQGIVGGGTVDDDLFDVVMSLPDDRGQASPHRGSAVASGGYDGQFHNRGKCTTGAST